MGDIHALWKIIQRCHVTYTQFPPMEISCKTIVQYHNQGAVMIQVKNLTQILFVLICVCVCVYTCIWVMCILVQCNVCFSSMQFIVCLGSLIQHHRQARHRKIPLSHGFLILAFYSHTSLPLHSLFLIHGNRIVCSPFL